MARIEIVIEDATGPEGDAGVEVRIESADPPMPIKDDTIDADAATTSQLFAFAMLMATVGLTETNLMLKTET